MSMVAMAVTMIAIAFRCLDDGDADASQHAGGDEDTDDGEAHDQVVPDWVCPGAKLAAVRVGRNGGGRPLSYSTDNVAGLAPDLTISGTDQPSIHSTAAITSS